MNSFALWFYILVFCVRGDVVIRNIGTGWTKSNMMTSYVIAEIQALVKKIVVNKSRQHECTMCRATGGLTEMRKAL